MRSLLRAFIKEHPTRTVSPAFGNQPIWKPIRVLAARCTITGLHGAVTNEERSAFVKRIFLYRAVTARFCCLKKSKCSHASTVIYRRYHQTQQAAASDATVIPWSTRIDP